MAHCMIGGALLAGMNIPLVYRVAQFGFLGLNSHHDFLVPDSMDLPDLFLEPYLLII